MLKWTMGLLLTAVLLVNNGPAVPQATPSAQPTASQPVGTIYPNAVLAQPRLATSNLVQSQHVEASPIVRGPSATQAAIAGRSLINAAGLSCTPPSAPAEIVELARALKWNPDLIYEYIRNNIQTLPVYDSLKGPLGTLIDAAGTPVDQADLMFSLLQQSCYSPQYEIGLVNVPASQLTAWLGVDNSTYSIGYALGDGGFSNAPHGSPITSVDIPWMWIGVPISGTTYYYDPAGKTLPPGLSGAGYQPRSSGIPLVTAMNYARASFLSDAESGASGIGTPSISGLNRTNVRSDLANFTNNLMNYIRLNNPSGSSTDIIGGAIINPLPPYTPPAGGAATTWGQTSSLANQVGSATSCTTLTGSSPCNFGRTTLTLQLGWNNSGGAFTSLASPVTFNSSDIYGHRVTASLNSSLVPSLLLDGVTQVTGTTLPSGNQLTIRASIAHPHLPAGDSVTNADNMKVGGTPNQFYVIGTGWGATSRGMIEKHRKLLQQNVLAGLSTSSEAVLGESLAMIGYTWLAEVSRAQTLTAAFSQTVPAWIHAVGIIGIKPVGAGVGPYVDLPLNTVGFSQWNNRPNSPLPTAPELAAFVSHSTISSIMESTAIEQTQPGAIAASTVKVLDLWSQTGVIYDINDPTISGDDCSYYVSNFRTPMSTSYSGGDLGRIDSFVGYSVSSCGAATANRIVAPSSGSITINSSTGSWTGGAYEQIQYSSPGSTDVVAIGQLITGGLSGGEPASQVPPVQQAINQGGSQTGAVYQPPSQTVVANVSPLASNPTVAVGGNSAVQPTGGDPVNLVAGNYIYSHQDLSVGSGAYPDTLPFIRSFDSGLGQIAQNTSLLGNGWMHNYDIQVALDSDGFEGMAQSSPINGAAGIVALYVLQDELNPGTTAKPTELLIIGAQIAKWLSEQITGNIVSVARAGNIERFVLLTDGSYNAPIGSASMLVGNPSSGFTLHRGDGTTLSFGAASYSTPAKITQWANAAGGTVNFNYDGSGFLMAAVNPATGRQLNFHYTSNLLSSVDDNTGPSPRTVSFGYDGSKNLVSVTDPLGFSTTYAYGALGQLTNIFYPTHPSSPFVTMSYDTLGRPNVQQDAANNATQLYFAGARTEIDDPVGTARVSYFDPFGRTLATIDGLGSAGINSGNGNLTTYVYDGLERPLSVTLPAGNGLAYTYDTYSNPLTVTQTPVAGSGLALLTTSFTYVSPFAGRPNFEKVQMAQDPLGLVTTSTYDASGNLVSVIADAGSGHFNAMSRSTYDAQGRVLTATDPLGVVTANSYDGLGNLVSTTADSGPGCGSAHLCQQTTISYDLFGNAVSVTDPRGNVTLSAFDANRRATTTTLPAAPLVLTTGVTYDPDGRVLQVQQSSNGQMLRTTSTTYTLTGKPATTTDANGNVTSSTYDTDDRLSTVTDALGRTTVYVYDALSRPSQTLNLAIQAQPLVQYGYTPNGKPANLTDGHVPSGNVTGFAYDGLDRLSTTTWPDSSTEVLGYDADSNILTRKTRAGSTITLTYDTLNRLSTKAAPGEATVTYAYDQASHVIAVSDNSAALAVPSASAGPFATLYTYDALNRPIGATWGQVPAAVAPTAASVTFNHRYNQDNQRLGQSVSDNSWLLYPAAAGTINYTANALNQYSAIGSVTPTYDVNGNLTFDGTFTYGYDAENRLISIAQGGTAVAAYAYDGRGRRKTKTVGGTITVSVTDADNREVLEYDGTSGQIGRWYAYGLGSNDVLNQMNVAAGTRETFIPDIQGSVLATLDSSSGGLTKAGYLPFGENGSAVTGTFRFTGQRFDAETAVGTAEPSGLYYYRARMYSPTLGRFLQPDPVGYQGGLHLYAYVGNDPLNFTDPFGLCDNPQACGGGALPEPGLGHPFGTLEQNVLAVMNLAPLPRVLGAAVDAYQVYQALPAPPSGTQQAWSGTINSAPAPSSGMTAYRVWGGGSGQQGAWLTPTAPASSGAAQSSLALPPANTAEFVSPVQIPGGTQLQYGTVAPAFGQPGGGVQIQLLERIPGSSFGAGVSLPP